MLSQVFIYDLFRTGKLGIYLNSFDWADRNDVLINVLHSYHLKSHADASNHYTYFFVLEGSNHNITNLLMGLEKESLQSN